MKCHVFVVRYQVSEMSCICVLGVSSQDSEMSCICVLGVSVPSQDSEMSCICVFITSGYHVFVC